MAYKLCPSMAAADVTATLKLALQASGLNQVPLDQHPRLLSDNGPSYVGANLPTGSMNKACVIHAANPITR